MSVMMNTSLTKTHNAEIDFRPFSLMGLINLKLSLTFSGPFFTADSRKSIMYYITLYPGQHRTPSCGVWHRDIGSRSCGSFGSGTSNTCLIRLWSGEFWRPVQRLGLFLQKRVEEHNCFCGVVGACFLNDEPKKGKCHENNVLKITNLRIQLWSNLQ